MNKIKDNLIEKILTYPKTCILISLIISSFLISGLTRLEMDFSARYWFHKHSMPIKTLDLTRSMFPAAQDLIVNIRANQSTFESHKNIQTIHKLTEELEQHPLVKKVESLTNFPYLFTNQSDEDIYFENIFEQDSIEHITKEFNKGEIYKKRFFSNDSKSTLIYLSLNHQKLDQVSLMKEVESFIENNLGTSFTISYGGFSALEHNFNIVSQEDLLLIIPLLCLIFLIILYYVYNSFLYALVPLVVFTFSTVIVFGLAGLCGMKFHNVSTIIPGVLITIAMADIMHITSTYLSNCASGMTHIESLKQSALKNFSPTLTTTLTTSAGFLSFATVDLAPVSEIGILCGFGTIMIWALTFFTYIPILTMLPKASKKEKKTFNLVRIFNFLLKRKRSVYIITGILFILCLFIASKSEFNTDPYKYFSKQTKMYHAVEDLEDNFNFIGGPEILVRTHGKLRTSQFMKSLYSFKHEVTNKTAINFIAGPMNMYEVASDALIQTKNISSNDKEISDIWNFLTLFSSQNSSIYDHISIDEKYIKLSITWKIKDSKSFLKELKKIEDIANKHNIDIEPTGSLLLYHQMTSSIVPTLVKSTLIAVGVIFIFFIILFRSLKIALLSLVPNILPLTFTFATAHILGYSIDLTVAMVAAVSFGLAVDDTTHIILQYKKELANSADKELAMKNVFKGTGQALVITTLALFIGFLSFSAGNFVPNAYFGLLCALAFLMALLMDIVLLPLILISIKL